MAIQRGDKVVVVDAFGVKHQRRAVSGAVAGGDFEVVWVCKEVEWEAAEAEARAPEAVPWPVTDVRPMANASA